MSTAHKYKLPLPVQISGFRFLISKSLRGMAVLEFDTLTNPIRVFLSKEQIEHLDRDTRIVLAKFSSQP
jgi:hypothetical protein